MIKKSGNRWIVYSKDGKTKLSACFYREEAEEDLEMFKKSGEYYASKLRTKTTTDFDEIERV